MGRTSNAELKRRVSVVEELLLDGATRAQIVRWCSDPDAKKKDTPWTASDRTADNYIAKANIEIGKAAKKDTELELGKWRRRHESLFQAAMKIQDFRLARSINVDIGEFLGLAAPTQHKHEVSGKVDHEHSGFVTAEKNPYAGWTGPELEVEVARLELARQRATNQLTQEDAADGGPRALH